MAVRITVLADNGEDYDGMVDSLSTSETTVMGGSAYEFHPGGMFDKSVGDVLSNGDAVEMVLSDSECEYVYGCYAEVERIRSTKRVMFELQAVGANSDLVKLFKEEGFN